MGNDRFATMDELKQVLKGSKTNDLRLTTFNLQENLDCGGPVLAYQGRRIWSHVDEGHTLYLGSTGTGKSRRGIIPLLFTLLYAGESAIVVDPKTELYWKTSWLAKRLGYDVRLVNFTNIFKSAQFNVLAEISDLYQSNEPAKQQTALDMVDELGQSLFAESKNDPFWADSARSVFKAAVIALLQYADKEEISLASVYQFITVGDERYLTKTYLQAFLDNLPAESAVARQMRSYCTTASDTRAGIRSTFLEGLSLFSRSDAMVEFFSGDDLRISELTGDKKTLTFICIPDRTPVYDKVCGVLVSQLMSHYIRIADEVFHGSLPIRHNFIVDEYGNISSALCNMPHLLSAGRSRGVRVHYVLQSLSQLTAAHSPADAKTILNNTDVIIAFRTNDWETMESLSKLTGERTIDYGKYQVKEPLMSPAQFQELDTGQAFVSLRGKHRFVAFLPDYEQMFDCSGWEAPTFPTRAVGDKINLFDIREHVTGTHKKKIEHSSRGSSFDCSPSISTSVDSLIAKMERHLHELDEADEKDNAPLQAGQTHSYKSVADDRHRYEVLVISIIGGSKPKVIRAVSAMCKITYAEAARKLESLPVSLPFATKKEADEAEKAISNAGAIAFAQEHT